MSYDEVQPDEVPLALLLEADPSEEMIGSYLPESLCFVANDNHQVVGACIVKPVSQHQAELCNISVVPELQGKGIGTRRLTFTLDHLRNEGFLRVELGTGTFGYQLAFYQRVGFRVHSVVKDHFINTYAETIYENGIQLKDMLRSYRDL